MLLKPVRNFCALRNCMNIFLPEIRVAHHTIGSILFIFAVLAHTLPDSFQRFFTNISKGERSVGTGHHFSVRSNMHPASARKAPKKAGAHKIWKSGDSGTFRFTIHCFLEFLKPVIHLFPLLPRPRDQASGRLQ